MKRLILGILVLLLVAACQPANDEALPTLVELPTIEPTEEPVIVDEVTATPTDEPEVEPTETPTDEATETATSTETLEPSATFTETSTPTETSIPTERPTLAPTSTPNPTRAVQASATAQVLEAPVISTFTPVSGILVQARPTSTGEPLVNADIIITERQFQEEMDRLLSVNPDIQSILVRFVSGGIDIEMTVQGDGAFVSGTIYVTFTLSNVSGNNLLIVEPVAPDLFRMSGLSEPPEDFIEIAYTTVVPALFESFNFILNQRLGEGQHDLENIQINATGMGITLVVPVN